MLFGQINIIFFLGMNPKMPLEKKTSITFQNIRLIDYIASFIHLWPQLFPPDCLQLFSCCFPDIISFSILPIFSSRFPLCCVAFSRYKLSLFQFILHDAYGILPFPYFVELLELYGMISTVVAHVSMIIYDH